MTSAGTALATENNLQENPCNLSKEDLSSLNVDPSSDVHAFSNYRSALRGMFREGQFGDLDCLADHLRSSKERFPGGTWKLKELYRALYIPVPYPVHATSEDWEHALRRLQEWASEKPKSVTARVALAWVYEQYAWDARGGGYADTVSNSGWRLFEERVNMAKQALGQAAGLPTKCPEWYVIMLEIGQDQGWDKSAMQSLFEKGFTFEPGYYYPIRAMGNYLQPKWGGEKGDTERFVAQIADRVGGDEGDALYFQAAVGLICGCEDEPQFSWPRIVKGFHSSERLYGDSLRKLNQIAFLASENKDAVVADEALSRIGDQWDEGVWQGKHEDFLNIKRWAASIGPMQAKQNEMESNASANLKTPEGIRYKAAFEQKYRKIIASCMKTGGDFPGSFETLTGVGAKGTIEEVRIYWNGVAAVCMYQRLLTLKQKQAKAFSAPPKTPYWIRLDLNEADFTANVPHPPVLKPTAANSK